MADLPVPAPRAELVPQTLGLAVAAAADSAAARTTFARYRERQAEETRRRHDGDLALFARYLAAAGMGDVGDLASAPGAWAAVSWGLVEGFVAWQLQQGYAIGSVNVRLSSVKTYARLAAKAGALDPEAAALITAVSGYRHAEGRRVDAGRQTTRTGGKKAAPVAIGRSQARRLKDQTAPRDRLLLCLLLDHGLRVGEAAILEARHFDLERGTLTFYRPKVALEQTHRLTADAHAAAEDALPTLPQTGPIFPGTRQLNRIVGAAGKAVGLAGLSPHDCRHAWATAASRAGTQIKALQDAGGWSSPAMPLRYAESAAIANDGVKLD